jgi:hypothetical protein
MGGAHPAWDLNPADLAVVSEECRSSFHHPTAPERHPWPGGGAFLGKNPPPSVRFEPLAPVYSQSVSNVQHFEPLKLESERLHAYTSTDQL